MSVYTVIPYTSRYPQSVHLINQRLNDSDDTTVGRSLSHPSRMSGPLCISVLGQTPVSLIFGWFKPLLLRKIASSFIPGVAITRRTCPPTADKVVGLVGTQSTFIRSNPSRNAGTTAYPRPCCASGAGSLGVFLHLRYLPLHMSAVVCSWIKVCSKL